MEADRNARVGEEALGERGKYRVVLKLSEGGTANIFLGVVHGRGGFNKLVVLKVPKEHVLQETESRRMFLNEARLAARLNHANIVQTNEVIDQGGHPIIVMEYLEGQALSSILARSRGSISLAMHLAIVSEALSGLQYVHDYTDFDGVSLNIVHRDMTPHNVFVTFDGHVKLLDFGIAKVDRADGGTETGVVKGKIRYMSPQQIVGEKLDRRADIFAVGMILWEAAARERMWRQESEPAVMHHIVNGEIPAPSSVNPDVSPELERIVMKALSPEPEARYATAAELQADLDAMRATLGAHATINREIGRFVSQLFADVREQTKKTVDASLSKVASLSWDEYLQAENALVGGTTLLNVHTGTAVPVGASLLPAKRSRLGLAVLGLVAVVALAVSLLRASRVEAPSQTTAASQAAPATADTPTTTPAQPAAVVDVNLSATPAEARLYFDDTALPTNPFFAKMARDGMVHRIHAEAPGYVTASTGILLDRDAAIVLTLEKERHSEPVGHGAVGRRSGTVATATAALPKPDCNPPFVIDERGIKKFKPECL
jgi:serine/threonine-protein kinase